MSIILKNATYVDYKNFEIKSCHIKVAPDSDNKFYNDFKNITLQEGDEVVDCTGMYVTRSLACGHHHAYSALARGMGGPLKPPANFYENLKYLWWALDKSLDKDAVETSALVTAMACAKNGVTFVIDHHASPFFTTGVLEVIAAAFEKVGIGHLLCFEISDRDGEKIAQAGLEATESYLSKYKGLVGLHASFTVGDKTLKKAVELAENYQTGIHIHTAEDLCDQEDCLRKYNMRVVERLDKEGVLQTPKTILVHCLHLSENERRLIAQSPVFIAQNIESNLNNNVGIFNGKDLNGRIMLGTDGMHSDMLRSFKAAYIYGQTSEKVSMQEVYKRLRNTHEYINTNGFGGNTDNNLIVIDYDTPTPVTAGNFLGHLLFGIETNHIAHVISNGKLIVKNRLLTTVDEKAIYEHAQQTAKVLWKRFKKTVL